MVLHNLWNEDLSLAAVALLNTASLAAALLLLLGEFVHDDCACACACACWSIIVAIFFYLDLLEEFFFCTDNSPHNFLLRLE